MMGKDEFVEAASSGMIVIDIVAFEVKQQLHLDTLYLLNGEKHEVV